MKKENQKFLAYGLVDPTTNIVRYVGITVRSLKERFVGHVSDVNNRPDLNKHKTAWFLKLRKQGLIPKIILLKECTNLEELKQFEIDYIKEFKEKNKLINQTIGGDHLGFKSHSRESILKRKTTKSIVQYNILGEKIAEYEITEDAARNLNLSSASHITSCCKGNRQTAYNYIWRYKDEPLGEINISPLSLKCCKLIQYDLNWNKIAEFNTTKEAAKALNLKSESNITACISGRQKTVKGFYFQAEPLYAYFDQNLFETKIKEYYNNSENLKKKNVNDFILCFKNNELIKEFNSFSQASEFVIGTINGRKAIKDCCDNKRETYHGYTFKYKSCPNLPNSGKLSTENETIQSYKECETTISKESTLKRVETAG